MIPDPPSTPARVMSVPSETMPGDTVRIAVAKLDAQLLDAEEMLAAKLAFMALMEG